MMASSYSSAMLLTILVLGGALVEAAGRPFGSWTDTASLYNLEDVGDTEEEGMTIPSFLRNYVSSLDPEKIKQYVTSLEEHTLGQHSLEFCQDANLMCDSNIAVEDPIDADEDDEIFQNSSTLDGDYQYLSFVEKDIVQGQDIVFPQSLQGSTYSSPPFLPHSLAEKMPFSSEKIFELLDILRISSNSKLATMMSRTVSRCELTKETSSKETTRSKEKEIKEKDFKGIDFIEKEKTGKGTKVKKEKSSKEKEVNRKDIERNIEEGSKGTYVKGGEKEFQGKDFKEKEVEKKELEVKKEKEFKKKDIEWNKEEGKEEGKEGNYKKRKDEKDVEFKNKEFENKELELNELEVKKEKSSKEKDVKKKDIEWNKEEGKKEKYIEGKRKKEEKFKDKEFKKKEIQKKELEVKKEKSSKEKVVEKMETKWNKDKDIEGKVTIENEFKKRDVKEKEAEVSKEKVVEEKEIEVTKAKSSKETLKCVMSLEGMTSFVKKSLPTEKHIKALETSNFSKFVKGDHKKVHWKISKVKKHEKAVVCKKQVFPFAVFKCHIISKTKGMHLYHIKLEGKGGVYRKEVLACVDKDKPRNQQQCKIGITSRSEVSCHWITSFLIWVPDI